jgi:hypothetical protein
VVHVRGGMDLREWEKVGRYWRKYILELGKAESQGKCDLCLEMVGRAGS